MRGPSVPDFAAAKPRDTSEVGTGISEVEGVVKSGVEGAETSGADTTAVTRGNALSVDDVGASAVDESLSGEELSEEGDEGCEGGGGGGDDDDDDESDDDEGGGGGEESFSERVRGLDALSDPNPETIDEKLERCNGLSDESDP